MTKLFKFIILIFIIFISYSYSQENYFEEAKSLFEKKNMMTQNFCLKEILFLTQKIQHHICI